MIELEPCWSGALERAGVAPGLSSYRGQSSLASAAEDEETREPGKRGQDRSPRKAYVAPRVLDPIIAIKLAQGASYCSIVRDLSVSMAVVRRVAIERGLERRPNTETIDRSKDADVLFALKRGLPYRAIADALNVSVSVARRVAKEHKIERSETSGTGIAT